MWNSQVEWSVPRPAAGRKGGGSVSQAHPLTCWRETRRPRGGGDGGEREVAEELERHTLGDGRVLYQFRPRAGLSSPRCLGMMGHLGLTDSEKS
jgi:hypothetical protein